MHLWRQNVGDAASLRFRLGGSVALLAALAVVGICASCSYRVTDKSDSVVARHVGVDGREISIQMHVIKKGRQYLIAPDGPLRRTRFVRAEYYLVDGRERVHLAFLDVDSAPDLWLYFGYVGGAWYAVDDYCPVSSEPLPQELRVVKFSSAEQFQVLRFPLEGIHCAIRELRVSTFGAYVAFKVAVSRYERQYYRCNLVDGAGSPVEIDEKQYESLAGQSVVLQIPESVERVLL
jgi:hypothetical protein